MNIAKRVINSLLQRSGRYVQSEDSNLKFQIDYTAQLQSDTILSSVWATESGSLVLTTEAIGDNVTSVFVAGQVGENRLVNKITTADGETIERIWRIKITDNDGDFPGCDY